MTNEALIVAAVRTPIGKAPKGSLRHTRPDDLAAFALQAVLARCPALDPQEIDDVILGCATPEGEQGMNIARVAALRAGLPQSTPGATVNRFCASGLEAIAIAAERIRAGNADVIIAGGVESMSRTPFLDIHTHPNPTLLHESPNTYLTMGLSVEQLARKHGITREQADAFALQSHQKAIRAQEEGLFDAEIAPVQTEIQTVDECGRPHRERITLTQDEGPRRDTSLEALAKLKPAFRADGLITAGNASQRSDGAAAVLVMSERKATALGVQPMLRFVGYTTAALTPEDFGVAPAYAIPKLLNRVGVAIGDVAHIEFNEAFAAQVLASNCIFEMPMERVNPLGGAIALGHPLGCTGARQVTTLAYALQRTGGRYGLVTMCAALGMGAAGLFERVG
ncbi:MAG: thiolase family protein [Fimbriimonadales bacterium]|nr:thiolase family protein [Fimbriimonadales bacterium]